MTEDKALVLNVDVEFQPPFKGWKLNKITMIFDDLTAKQAIIYEKYGRLPELTYPAKLYDSGAGNIDPSIILDELDFHGHDYIQGDLLNIVIAGTGNKKCWMVITVQQLRGKKKPPEQPSRATEVEQS